MWQAKSSVSKLTLVAKCKAKRWAGTKPSFIEILKCPYPRYTIEFPHSQQLPMPRPGVLSTNDQKRVSISLSLSKVKWLGLTHNLFLQVRQTRSFGSSPLLSAYTILATCAVFKLGRASRKRASPLPIYPRHLQQLIKSGISTLLHSKSWSLASKIDIQPSCLRLSPPERESDVAGNSYMYQL